MSGFDKSDQDKSFTATEAGGFDTPKESADQRPFMVIDDRVFQTEEDVRKFYANANQHIQTLEGENKGYKEREEHLSKAAEDGLSARELLEGIKAHSQASKAESSVTPSISKEDLDEELARARREIKEELKSDAQKEVEKHHLDEAVEKAQAAYGEKWKEEVIKIGKENGLSPAQVNNLAKTSPVAFSKLFLPESKPAASGPTGGSVNTQAVNEPDQTKPPAFMKLGNINDRAAEVRRRIEEKMAQAKRGDL